MGRPKRPGWTAFNDLATDETLQALDPELFRAWFQLRCAAQPHDGVIPMGVAKEFKWSTAKGVRYLMHLERAGLIEKHKKTFRFVHWASAGRPPKSVKERVKRYRDRKKAGVTLQENHVTLHDQPVTLQPTEVEKTQQNQSLTSSKVRLLDPNSDVGSPLTLPSPVCTSVVNKEEGKQEETKGVKGRAAADVTLPKTKPSKDVTLHAEERFEEFWQLVRGWRGKAPNPRKPAARAFEVALKNGANFEHMLAGAAATIGNARDAKIYGTEKVPQVVTWIHQERWKDVAQPPKTLPQVASTASERAMAASEVPGKVFVDEGTEAWNAWQAYRRARHQVSSIVKKYHDPATGIVREGWWFDSAYPPGVRNGKATEGEQGRPATEDQSNVTGTNGGSGDGPARPADQDGPGEDFGAAAPDADFA